MIATEYAPLARRTLKELPRNQHLIHMALGLCGEMGEFIDAVKKFVIYGKPLDLTNLTEETGDECWYVGNLLPELGVSGEVLQRAIDEGFTVGTKACLEQADPFEHAKMLLQVNLSIATVAAATSGNPDKFLPGSSTAAQAVEALGAAVGLMCGVYRLDPAQAMDLNIKKLAKRYGDKYSDLAALNRDTAAERKVLEGVGNVVWSNSFDGSICAAVTRKDEGTGVLKVWASADNKVLHEEDVTLVYGALVGPDVDDVASWNKTALAVIAAQFI